jgi:hypothetical protein
VFGVWRSHSGPQGLVLAGDEFRAYYEYTSPLHVLPGPDGKTVFTGIGVFPRELRAADQKMPHPFHTQPRGPTFCVPAQHAPFYLAVEPCGPYGIVAGSAGEISAGIRPSPPTGLPARKEGAGPPTPRPRPVTGPTWSLAEGGIAPDLPPRILVWPYTGVTLDP